MGISVFQAVRRSRPTVRLLACVICFGLAGLVWSLPRLRNRRLRRVTICETCAAHQRVRNVAVFAVAVLLVGGSLARLETALVPQTRCHSHISQDGEVRPEPLLDISPPRPWAVTRSVLAAPISGVGVLTGWALGMESCSGPPLLVMFWPPPRTSGGGTTFGDVFVAWLPPRTPAKGRGGENSNGSTDEKYIRFGPNISQTRVNEAELGSHESRHVDQWALGTLLAGPFAFPLAYVVDGMFFPGSRNHFERDAGLSRGGYPPVADNWPTPVWPQASGPIAVAAFAWRRRLRWMIRVAVGGRQRARMCAPGRCPVHTTGWRSVPQAGQRPG